MRKKFFLLTAAALILSGCSQANEAEILIPIYDSGSGSSYTTAAAEYRDITDTASIGGKVDYVYSEAMTIDYDCNVLEFNVKKNMQLKEGDVIAVFDSSALDFEYQNQKILADNAYSRYAASGSELDRLNYEQEKAALDLVQYKIDKYTIKAPYDCIVTQAHGMDTGTAVSAGTQVCAVAHPEEIYVYTNEKMNYFSTGMSVQLKFGTNDYYSAKVVMTPDPTMKGKSGINSAVIIAFDDGELERATKDVGNIVTSGWATIIVNTVDKHGVLCIPAGAVQQYSGSTYCYIDNNGSRARIPVEVGETYGGYTVVLSGLSEGDIVSYK